MHVYQMKRKTGQNENRKNNCMILIEHDLHRKYSYIKLYNG